MAALVEEVSYDRLYHFIAAGIWDEAPLQQALMGKADRLVGGADAILVVYDTALPKKGNRLVGLALFLPETWTANPDRMARASVPEDRRAARTKLEIAVVEIDRIREGGVRFGCVLADAGYGCSAPFRQALSERGLVWAFGITGRNKVYPADVAMIFPVAGRGRPRQRNVPDQVSVAAETILADITGRSVTWRHGTKGRLRGSLLCVARSGSR